MESALNALHLVDETREISLWILPSHGGFYKYEIIARKFESGSVDEEVTGNDELFDSAKSAADAGVARAISIYQCGGAL